MIQHLDLSYNDIHELSFLEPFTNLLTLNLAENQITSLKDLPKLIYLKSLNLIGNKELNFE